MHFWVKHEGFRPHITSQRLHGMVVLCIMIVQNIIYYNMYKNKYILKIRKENCHTTGILTVNDLHKSEN